MALSRLFWLRACGCATDCAYGLLAHFSSRLIDMRLTLGCGRSRELPRTRFNSMGLILEARRHPFSGLQGVGAASAGHAFCHGQTGQTLFRSK